MASGDGAGGGGVGGGVVAASVVCGAVVVLAATIDDSARTGTESRRAVGALGGFGVGVAGGRATTRPVSAGAGLVEPAGTA